MLLIFIGVCDLTIDSSWLNPGSSMHMSFDNFLHCEKHLNLTCLLEFKIWSWDYILMLLLLTLIMLRIFIGVCDLTIDLSWLSFESSIHVLFDNLLHLVMRLHFDVTSDFYRWLWPDNRFAMTEFWKLNTYAVW